METILELLMQDTEQLKSSIHEYVEKYKPIAYTIAQEFVEIYKDFANNQEYLATVAKARKNMYDAYINAGFNENQALAFMINDNLQLVKNLKQISSSKSVETKKWKDYTTYNIKY